MKHERGMLRFGGGIPSVPGRRGPDDFETGQRVEVFDTMSRAGGVWEVFDKLNRFPGQNCLGLRNDMVRRGVATKKKGKKKC